MHLGRSHVLIVCCGVVFVTALILRVRSQRAEVAVVLAQPASASGLMHIAEPRDYVLAPLVAVGEAEAGPRRIVSLAPNVTETLCALGFLDQLVGRTQFCTYPPGVGHVRVVGGLMDTNLELIRELGPGLVVTTANSYQVNAKLTALGMNHASLTHESLADVFTAIEQSGAACHRPETARMLSAAVRADLERLQAEARAVLHRRLRVLMVVGGLPVPPAAPWVAGPGSFLGDLLALTGQTNAAADVVQQPFGQIPLELLLVVDPDVILTFPDEPTRPERLIEVYRTWAKVGSLRAIQSQHVRCMGGPEWGRASPRIALGLHRLVMILSEFQ